MKALATIASGPMGPVLDQALPSFRAYADAHGYDLVIGQGEAQGRHPSWARILLLNRLLESHEAVLWLDSDMVIVDPSEDLASEVPADSFQAFAEIPGPDGELAPNLGVWFVRSCERSKELLDLIWNSSVALDSQGMWENLALLEIMGYATQRPYRKRSQSRWDQGTVFLRPEWNALTAGTGWSREARILHFSAMPHAKRIALMRLAQLYAEGRCEDRRGVVPRHYLTALRRLQLSFYIRRRGAADRRRYFADRLRS